MEIAWFKKIRKPKQAVEHKRIQVPEGLWVKCNSCKEIIYKKEVVRNANVCPKCNYHFRISARERLAALFDEGRYQEVDTDIYSVDPLRFRDVKSYRDRLREYREKTGLNDAVINARGTMGGLQVTLSVMEYGFMGGSMGSAVGEKVTRAVERSLDERIPLIVISCSGGARMQEGILSLMQMAKISAALGKLREAGIPYISILTDPTTGGVTASYAMLGDLNIAEPKALIGFAGPRVIEQTIREKLPEGFQRSEFLVDHGMIDFIVERREMREALIRCMKFMMNRERLVATAPAGPAAAPPAASSGEAGAVSEPAASGQTARPREPLQFPTPLASRGRPERPPEVR
ncbi:MAG TPA: acetyl-CoA carboxylase, carboxyltransferase subunit beta [Candidatus Polarisedimenticolia bacterium]|nr:acetyl-CoA carboxylase, carboxyltransferase subunit beta [Candidatus Polarisedimenticolia bacterium]